MTNQPLHCGIDIGSTTIKMVVLDEKKDKVLFSDYQRHHANISSALTDILKKAFCVVGNQAIAVCVTGSAGMGVSERYGLQFAQEVIAATDYISHKHREIQTLIDIGGEDTKMVFLKAGSIPDIRMNGSCAGGTGAFIDQMATILAVDIAEMSRQALSAGKIYPIASRCGVFSKTDVQNLIARNVSIADISASVFHAVALQTITSLSRGTEPLPKIFFCGGPLAFIPALRQAFVNYLKLKDEDYIISENAALIPAFGCALTEKQDEKAVLLNSLIEKIESINKQPHSISKGRLNKLFDNQAELEQWIALKQNHRLESITLEKLEGNECFIGIDSGSTTTKIVAIDDKERIVFQFYSRNKGNPLKTISEGLSEFLVLANSAKKDIHIVASSVTGYGEDLVKAAYNIDHGIVETIAHYSAAQKFNPKVSFILDIGGQDMKAIFVENGVINRLEINEACSSGCGSFIEGFAKSLNYTAANFATLACNANAPCDLGTRCTVFMNSKVKQFLREGASVADISAGLAYSVVKNCLYKVLKIKDVSELGDNIVVQGGAMRNHAVVRALELLTGKEVIFSDVPELMGAYGAALFACRMHKNENIHNVRALKEVASLNAYQSEQFYCSGCENNCIINKYTFHNGNSYFSGNKCEKIYSNKGQDFVKGENHYNFKYNKIVAQKKVETTNPIVIGIPRILNMYENMQFWLTLFNECGIKTVLSGRSTFTLYEKGLPYVMSDNICFPAKLVHGHIIDLIDKKANRIFMPYVVYESKEDKNTPNSFNCPIVSGYSDVIKSSMPFLEKHNICIDAPTIAFNNEQLLTKACIKYLMTLGIEKSLVEKALPKALAAQRMYVSSLQENCQRIIEKNSVGNNMVIMLVGRPYHADPLIQHKISDMISAFGVDVISEDFVRSEEHNTFDNVQTIMQWAYTNRILKAAEWVAKTNANVHLVQMTSFGCGPDAFIIDEVNEILKRHGKSHTILKIDDVNNIG
ncbi:MAG TPA: acyl-CoA dehydratase activase-related protein, partial [Bacteroidales bacterium]